MSHANSSSKQSVSRFTFAQVYCKKQKRIKNVLNFQKLTDQTFAVSYFAVKPFGGKDR